jgi:hypothetical protein
VSFFSKSFENGQNVPLLPKGGGAQKARLLMTPVS